MGTALRQLSPRSLDHRRLSRDANGPGVMTSSLHKKATSAHTIEDPQARAESLLFTPSGIEIATVLSNSSSKVEGGSKPGRVEGDDPREGRDQGKSLPNGMTAQLMRQVAALDVTRMSCPQASMRRKGRVIKSCAFADAGERESRFDVLMLRSKLSAKSNLSSYLSQITQWFADEDTGKKMQHRVLNVDGKWCCI